MEWMNMRQDLRLDYTKGDFSIRMRKPRSGQEISSKLAVVHSSKITTCGSGHDMVAHIGQFALARKNYNRRARLTIAAYEMRWI